MWKGLENLSVSRELFPGPGWGPCAHSLPWLTLQGREKPLIFLGNEQCPQLLGPEMSERPRGRRKESLPLLAMALGDPALFPSVSTQPLLISMSVTCLPLSISAQSGYPHIRICHQVKLWQRAPWKLLGSSGTRIYLERKKWETREIVQGIGCLPCR